jgi:hypothetical protein
MRYFKFALAAGASIIVAARMSPAYALPPVYPLDPNGPIRQGDMCIAPGPANWENIDTGYGYTRFYECGHHKRAHREAHGSAHEYARVAPSAPPYHHLDINGPIRQGRWCIEPGHGNFETVDTGYGYGYFYECAPVWTVSGHHHHHAHHAHHHHIHHHRHHHHAHVHHALHLESAATQADCGMILPHAGGSDVYAYATEQDQQSWPTIANTDGIEATVYDITVSNGGIDLASENVTGGNDVTGRLQGDGGLPAQLAVVDHGPVVSLEWIRIAAGEQVSHSMMRRDTGERIVKLPFGSDRRHAPVDPVLSPLSALGQRSLQPQLRRADFDAGQKSLTGGDYSSPLRSEAGGGMSITATANGCSQIVAVLGLILAIAAPIALVATQIPVSDKSAVIDTVSDPIAETEWYVPSGNKLTVDQRTVSISPLAGAIKTAGLAATF